MDLEARLSEEAASGNLSREEFAKQLIAMALPPSEFKSNAEAIEYWKQIGLIGMWAGREEMKNSTVWVRRLRDGAAERSREKMGVPK